MKRLAILVVIAVALLGASPPPAPDPAAVAVVNQYMQAIGRGDFNAAFALLTSAQQRYFASPQNLASNSQSTNYVIHKYAIANTLSHGSIVEVVVRQNVSFLNIATQRSVDGAVREPFFALRENGAWRVKQLYQPWKSYAPNASGTAQDLEVVVNRVEFYDKRLRLDCTIRNRGKVPIQVLPVAKTTLDIGGGPIPAINEATFPLNDVTFFEGLRLYPNHQAVGYINFPLAQKTDETQSFTLTLGPAIYDGAEKTFMAVVGPFRLAKL